MSNRSVLLKDTATSNVLDGEYPASALFLLKPTAQRTASTANLGWRYRRRYTIQNNATEALVNFPFAIDIGNTQSLVSGGKAQADGDDLRVWSEGREIGRVLVDWNAASFNTLVWIIIKHLPVGGTMTVEVVYGNSVATAGPALIPFSERPPFDISTAGANRSTNAKWVYNIVKTTTADAGKGAWPLSSGTVQPDYNFAAPGAWTPDNTKGAVDDHQQNPYTAYVVSSATYYQAGFDARRARGGSSVVLGRLGGDGVRIHVPTTIQSLRCNFLFTNMKINPAEDTPIGRLVILGRRVMGAEWFKVYENAAVAETESTIAVSTYSLPAGTKDVACAIWPYDNSVVSFAASGDRYAEAKWDSILELNLDSSLVVQATAEAEVEIYEFGDLVTYGSSDGTGEYEAIRLGNYDQASGAGVPRMAVKINDPFLAIDNEGRRVDVYNSGMTALVESISPNSYQAIQRVYKAPIAQGSIGVSESDFVITNDQDWIQIFPWADVISNPRAETNALGWTRDQTTAGITTAALGRSVSGGITMFTHNITANSAGAGATFTDTANNFIPVGEVKSLWMGFDYLTPNVNLQPTPVIKFYTAAQVFISEKVAPDWTIAAANTWYRAFLSAVVPAGAVYAKISVRVKSKTAGLTGIVNTTQWIVDGPDVTMLRVNPPANGMIFNFRSKARYAYA